MQDLKALLDQFLGQPKGADAGAGQNNTGSPDLQNLLGGAGGLATGALAGGLAGLLLGGKKPRKLAKSALKVGGVALVGGLAYKAWQNWQANNPPAASAEATPTLPPSDTPFLPSSKTEQEDLSRTLMRAMVAAAKSDGHVSIEERRRIAQQLEGLEIDADDRSFLEDELSKPLDVDAIARDAKNPEQAAEIYAASLLAIDPEGPAERGYLAMLAARLKLDPKLVDHLHAQTAAVVEPV